MNSVQSVGGVSVRLTDERWAHITENHCEMAGFRIEVLEAVANPDKILAGNSGELLAIKEHSPGRSIVAVYREAAADGFVITAFTTSRTGWMERRRQLWP